MKYYWNQETINHFKFISSYLTKKQTMEKIELFIEVDCIIQEDESEKDLALDLMKQIFNN